MIGGGVLLAVSAILYATAPVPTFHLAPSTLGLETVQSIFAGAGGAMEEASEYTSRLHQMEGCAALGVLLFLAGAIVGLTRRWSPAGRLQQLQTLHAQGLISADELAARRSAIVQSV